MQELYSCLSLKNLDFREKQKTAQSQWHNHQHDEGGHSTEEGHRIFCTNVTDS